MKRVLCIILAVGVCLIATASKPKWLHRLPTSGNSTYTFIPITVEAPNLASGRTACLKMLSLDRELLSSLKVHYRAEDTTIGISTTSNVSFSEQLETKTIEVTTFEGTPIQLQAGIVDEYINREKGTMTTLYCVGITENPIFDDITVTTSYGWRGILSIVPGCGQFYKGSYLKGGLMLGGCAVAAGCVIFTESQRSDYMSKISKTHRAELKRSYATKADHYAVGRNICIGAGAALYLYNIIDAFVAPGARRVVVKERNYRNIALAPTIMYNGAPGIGLSIGL